MASLVHSASSAPHSSVAVDSFLRPSSPVSFVTQSAFVPIPFSDEREGMIYAIETPGDMIGKPLDLIFRHVMSALSPIWHHIRDLGSLEGCDIFEKDFYFRALKISPDGSGLEVMPLSVMEEFWLACSYEMLTSAFFSSRESAFRINSLMINSSNPFSFTYEGKEHIPVSPRTPHYVLELATRKDGFHSSLIYERLVHRTIYDQWLAHIPEHKESLDSITNFIVKERVVLRANLDRFNHLILNLTGKSPDPKYVLINKLAHKIEAFFIRGSSAYGLTSFVNYHVVQIAQKDEAAFDAIVTAQRTCKAYCRLFEPEFEFRLNSKSKYVAFKMNGWDSFLELLTKTLAAGLILRSKDLDHAIMTWTKAVNVLHAAGCQLNKIDMDQMFCKLGPVSNYQYKIMLSESVPFVDGLLDTKQLAVIFYNLFVKYKLYNDIVGFVDPSTLTSALEAEMVAHCEALKINPEVPGFYHRKLDLIHNLLKGTISLKDFSCEFEKYFNEVHYGVVLPEPTKHLKPGTE